LWVFEVWVSEGLSWQFRLEAKKRLSEAPIMGLKE